MIGQILELRKFLNNPKLVPADRGMVPEQYGALVIVTWFMLY